MKDLNKEELLELLHDCVYEGKLKFGQEYARGFEQIAAILKNQPTITEKDIQGWSQEARIRVMAQGDWSYTEDVMKEMLDDIGVSILPAKSGK